MTAANLVCVQSLFPKRRSGPARLRELLNSGQTVVAPGAFDPLAARLVEEAGFAAVYMTGFGADDAAWAGGEALLPGLPVVRVLGPPAAGGAARRGG